MGCSGIESKLEITHQKPFDGENQLKLQSENPPKSLEAAEKVA